VKAADSLWEDRIKQDVDTQLAAKGWTRVDSDASATICAIQSTQDQQTLETFYNGLGGGWRWRGVGGSTATTTDITKVGTLVVDIFDARTHKLIWRGKESDALNGNPQRMKRSSQKTFPGCSSTFPRHTEMGFLIWRMTQNEVILHSFLSVRDKVGCNKYPWCC
jgi:hypothetical protein